MSQSQFSLIGQRRFGPFFGVQFFGAFNDNIYKNAVLILVTISFTSADENKINLLNNLGAAAFIIPFFLFSAIAGQLADKYNKAILIRYIKLAEIFIMMAVSYAFYLQSFTAMIVILFLMGMQSAFFSPVKYSILPEHLNEHELVGGNGLVEMGTFVAILLGTICGGLLISLESFGTKYVASIVVIIAVLGWLSSFFIPFATPARAKPDLKINYNPISQIWNTLKIAASTKAVFLSILGISWFWFYGSIMITQIPNYSKLFLGGTPIILTLILTTASVGIGIGSLLCEKLSGHKIEIGLVPFGSIGMTLFALDLSFAKTTVQADPVAIEVFLQTASNWRVIFDFFMIGLFSGIYSVPLYVLLQIRTKSHQRSQIIAANSIMNALFMTIASGFAIFVLSIGLSIPNLFLVVSLLNAAVALYIYRLVPEFLMRFIVWLLIHSVYRLQITNNENIPDRGAAIITCNHVSFLDPLVIMASSRRPIRFVMDHRIFKIPVLKFVFKTAGCIPIAPAKEDPVIKEQAFKEVSKALEKGDLIGLFPEGGLTPDGLIQSFRPGIDRIIKNNPVPIIPCALQGLWGSYFSRKYGKAMLHIPRKFLFAKIYLFVGKVIPPEEFQLKNLEKLTKQLHGEWS